MAGSNGRLARSRPRLPIGRGTGGKAIGRDVGDLGEVAAITITRRRQKGKLELMRGVEMSAAWPPLYFLFFSLLSHSAARRTRDTRFEPESGQADATIVREYRKADPDRKEKFHTVLSNFDHSASLVSTHSDLALSLSFFIFRII